MNQTATDTLGARIRKLRLASGMSQDVLARRMGVSSQMPGKWERDEAVPQLDKRLALAQLFDVEPAVMDYDLPANLAPQAPPWFEAYVAQQEQRFEQQNELLTQLRKTVKSLENTINEISERV